MLETQFLLINTHFTLNLLAALVCFSVSWLYFDAWLGRKDHREFTKMLGFLLLTLSFVVKATTIEQSILQDSIFAGNTLAYLTAIFRISGYVVLIIGQFIDPLQPLPSYRKGGFGVVKNGVFIFGSNLALVNYMPFAFPVLAAFTGLLYIRRATKGLEFHLRAIGFSFLLLAFSELLSLAAQFQGSSNMDLEELVKVFGPLWTLERVILVISMLVLGKWVWGYLIKRLETQLFIILTSSTLVIFLLTAIFFTSVSLINLRTDVLQNLKTNVAVLKFTIESKKEEELSNAQVIAQNPEVIKALAEGDKKTLEDFATASLLAKKEATLIITSESGEVIMRGEDPEKIGGSLSDNHLVKKALEGTNSSSMITKEGVMAPVVSVQAAVAVKANNETIGSVLTGSTIDNAFVDGLKEATGLDASIYGDNIRSATTFIAPDGKSRWIGIREETEEIKDTVLSRGEQFSGDVNILNVPYLAAFLPIKDLSGDTIGMLFVGKPQISTVQAISKLIEQTFVVTAFLLMISVIPAYLISRHIINQVHS